MLIARCRRREMPFVSLPKSSVGRRTSLRPARPTMRCHSIRRLFNTEGLRPRKNSPPRGRVTCHDGRTRPVGPRDTGLPGVLLIALVLLAREPCPQDRNRPSPEHLLRVFHLRIFAPHRNSLAHRSRWVLGACESGGSATPTVTGAARWILLRRPSQSRRISRHDTTRRCRPYRGTERRDHSRGQGEKAVGFHSNSRFTSDEPTRPQSQPQGTRDFRPKGAPNGARRERW